MSEDGTQTVVSGDYSTVIGNNSSAKFNNCFILGSNLHADHEYQLKIKSEWERIFVTVDLRNKPELMGALHKAVRDIVIHIKGEGEKENAAS